MPRPSITGREARVKLPQDLYAQVKRDARASGNSIAAQVRTALIEYYRHRGEQSVSPSANADGANRTQG
jgi:hypothetical protein